MEVAIPAAIRSLSSSGAAVKSLSAWWRKSKGDARALLGEMKENLIYLDLVADDGVPLADVVEKLALTEYKRLAKEGFNFNKLKKATIEPYPSLQGTDLEAWGGKSTEDLINSIYDKLTDLTLRFPHVENHRRYRWSVRVNNIRKRLWLLLRHIED